MSPIQREVLLRNRDGLHARPISRIVDIANRFDASLTICRDGLEADGRSVLQLLTLAAPKGSTLVLTAEGADAESLLEALQNEIHEGFGEPIE